MRSNRSRWGVAWASAVAVVLAGGIAVAEEAGAEQFVQQQHQKLTTLLHQPASAGRDAQVNKELDGMVDYEELAHRSLGEPCPPSLPSCTDWSAKLADEDRAELTKLLKQLVEKNYRKNLEKTLDYDVVYKGQKALAGDTKIRTEAKSKSKPRDPAVQVDYVVKPVGGAWKVVDIVTEGSSLTKNYYDQFDKKFKAHPTPHEGFLEIRDKLNEKLKK
jgi:phospholipid transport system substrate-binding protein